MYGPAGPADAGMDLWSSGLIPQPSRGPRGRGDGPHPAWPQRPAPTRAPRTRGWTSAHHPVSRVDGAGPADAGMDRVIRVWSCPRLSGPRGRGDGPACLVHVVSELSRVPRTRGWTLARQPLCDGGQAGPADAGMDRSGWEIKTERRCGPRGRGDEPHHSRCLRVRLVERCIRASSEPGDVVWEPFGGLCTAALAAHRAGRVCYSAEIDGRYHAIAQDRLRREAEGDPKTKGTAPVHYSKTCRIQGVQNTHMRWPERHNNQKASHTGGDESTMRTG